MDWEWFPEIITLGKRKGIEVFASVFDRSGWDYVMKCGCKSVKLSYSQANSLPLYPHQAPLKSVYVSQDIMSPALALNPIPVKGNRPEMQLIRLYCLPVYPVPYVVDFEGIFPRFHGFSSHCLGIEQEIRAVKAGAEVLEFHFQGDWVSDTPDGRFAKTPTMAEKICKAVR
jgi:sialic acid synthase SpsE